MTHEAAGVILFKHIFRIAPQALPLFSFGRVEGAEVNDALFEQEDLKAHATKVVATVATAVGMLTKLDELVPILTSLGTKHVCYGVVPEHYAVVGEALIATLSDALGDAFDAETKSAWVAVYGIVQKTMIGDNYDTVDTEKENVAEEPKPADDAALSSDAEKLKIDEADAAKAE